jgi:hypothetical protein
VTERIDDAFPGENAIGRDQIVDQLRRRPASRYWNLLTNHRSDRPKNDAGHSDQRTGQNLPPVDAEEAARSGHYSTPILAAANAH